MTLLYVLVIFLAGYKIITNWRKKVTINPPQSFSTEVYPVVNYPSVDVETYYESHCWNCQDWVDSRGSSKCYKCERFHCNTCGKCLCEKNYRKSKGNYKKEWKLENSYSTSSKNRPEYYHYPKSYNSSSKSNSDYSKQNKHYSAKAGFCKRCSKKLRGDTSKALCYECWKSK